MSAGTRAVLAAAIFTAVALCGPSRDALAARTFQVEFRNLGGELDAARKRIAAIEAGAGGGAELAWRRWTARRAAARARELELLRRAAGLRLADPLPAFVTAVGGAAWLHRAGARTPLKALSLLRDKDRLVTELDAHAELVFPDGTRLLLGPPASFHFGYREGGDCGVLTVGRLHRFASSPGRAPACAVKTPLAVVTTMGAEFDVTSLPQEAGSLDWDPAKPPPAVQFTPYDGSAAIAVHRPLADASCGGFEAARVPAGAMGMLAAIEPNDPAAPAGEASLTRKAGGGRSVPKPGDALSPGDRLFIGANHRGVIAFPGAYSCRVYTPYRGGTPSAWEALAGPAPAARVLRVMSGNVLCGFPTGLKAAPSLRLALAGTAAAFTGACVLCHVNYDGDGRVVLEPGSGRLETASAWSSLRLDRLDRWWEKF